MHPPSLTSHREANLLLGRGHCGSREPPLCVSNTDVNANESRQLSAECYIHIRGVQTCNTSQADCEVAGWQEDRDQALTSMVAIKTRSMNERPTAVTILPRAGRSSNGGREHELKNVLVLANILPCISRQNHISPAKTDFSHKD